MTSLSIKTLPELENPLTEFSAMPVVWLESIAPEAARVVVSLTGIVAAAASMPAESATGQLVSVSVPVLHRKILYCLKSVIKDASESAAQERKSRQLFVSVLEAS